MSSALAFVLLGGVGSTTATAGTASCRVGPADDGTAPATDIVCFTLNADCVNTVGALRLRTTDTTTYPTTMFGAEWSLAFVVGGVRHDFVLARSVTGQDSATMHVAGAPDQTPSVRLDETTIIWSVPRSATAALQQGGIITELTATAKDALGQGWERTAKTSLDSPRRLPSCN